MKKVSIWSLVAVLALLLYLVLTMFFRSLFQVVTDRQLTGTNTPAPTFTPAPAETAVAVETLTPRISTPSPTPPASPTPGPTATDRPTTAPTLTLTPTPTPVPPQVVSSITVNIRSGPGTNYPVTGSLPPNTPLVIIGQNEAGTWWQVQRAGNSTGWVAGSVVEPSPNVDVPIVQAPTPPPQPTPTPAPVEPTPVPPVAYQYEPTGWYDDTNYGLTRFLGTITDANGNPVDGVFVEAQCGDFRVISNPSGPVGWGPFNESHTWPPGFYDITLDTKPIPCHWFLSVVETPDKETVSARLSAVIEVETTIDKSIVVANWRKNW